MKFLGNRKYLSLIIFSVFIVCFIYSLTGPISDPDLFWHLASGKWILEHHRLPDLDPFAFTTQAYAYDAYQRTFFILTSYWLAQVIIYFFYIAGGYWGILAFRILIFLGIIGVLLKWLKEKGYRLSDALLFLIPVATASTVFIGERPNQLSYLLSLVSLYFIYAVKERSRKGWLLVPVMILWANLHGGFILGMLIITIFMGFEIIDNVLKKKRGEINNGGYPKAMLIYGSSLVACGINPSGFKVFPTLMEMSADYSEQVAENISPLTLYSTSGNYSPLLISVISVIFLLIVFIVGIRRKAADVPLSAGLVLLLVIMSFKSLRYIPFLVLLPVPFAADYIKPYLDRLRSFFMNGLLALFLMLFIVSLPPINRTVAKAPLVNPLYPEGLVKFMKANNIRENMFNIYDIGGYLIWRLYPDNQVFIDGRGVVQKVFFAYLNASQGSKKDLFGMPEWKSILHSYNVKNIILTPLRTSGTMYDLVDRLYEDPEWRLVYIDGESGAMLFRNDSSLPELPKILSYSNILLHALKYQVQRPENKNIYITLAKLDLILGRKSEAIKVLEDAIRKYPAFKTGHPGQALDYIQDNRTWW